MNYNNCYKPAKISNANKCIIININICNKSYQSFSAKEVQSITLLVAAQRHLQKQLLNQRTNWFRCGYLQLNQINYFKWHFQIWWRARFPCWNVHTTHFTWMLLWRFSQMQNSSFHTERPRTWLDQHVHFLAR